MNLGLGIWIWPSGWVFVCVCEWVCGVKWCGMVWYGVVWDLELELV